MSGHSHWATIKHKKGAEDARRGKMFSKLTRELTVAVREKGANIDSNPKLRMLMDKAREINMPKDNIERVVKKASGEDKDAAILEEFLFEILGHGEVAILVEGITDNKNRTLGDIKRILNKCGGKLTGEGALKWQFEKKGEVIVNIEDKNQSDAEMAAIEAGADDIEFDQESQMFVYTQPENVETVKKNLETAGFLVKTFAVRWIAKEEKQINEETKQSLIKLFEELDESDDVQEIYSSASF